MIQRVLNRVLCAGIFQGLQWCLLKEEEVVPRILAMEGQRGRVKSLEFQSSDDPAHSHSRKRRSVNAHDAELVNAVDAKLLRRLEAQGKIESPHANHMHEL